MMARKNNMLRQRPERLRGAGRATAGFTLIETMMALLILVLLTGVVASGIPVASQTYTKAVDASNAQVALTTTAAKLRDELGLAQDVFFPTTGGDERNVEFFKTSDGYWAKIENPGANQKGLYVQAYYGVPDASSSAPDYGMTKIEGTNGHYPLIPESAIVGDIKVTFGKSATTGEDGNETEPAVSGITYNYKTGTFTVNNLTATYGVTGTSLGTAGGTTTDGKLYVRAALY